MFWKTKTNFHRTLKFKIAMWTTTLNGFCAMIVILIVYLILYDIIQDQIDLELEGHSCYFEHEYFENDSFPFTPIITDVSKFPIEIKQNIQHKYPSFNIQCGRIYSENDLLQTASSVDPKKQVKYCIFGKNLNQRYAILLNKNYEIVSDKQVKIFGNLDELKNEFAILVYSRNKHRAFFMLIDDNDKSPLIWSDFAHWGSPQQIAQNLVSLPPGYHTQFFSNNKPIIRLLGKKMYDDTTLWVGVDSHPEHSKLLFSISFFIILNGLITLLSTTAAWIIVSKTMSEVEAVAQYAEGVNQHQFLTRIPVKPSAGIEVINLINSFNEMSSRVENLIKELKDVSCSIAHDLKTPLTRIYGQVEMMMLNAPENDTQKNETYGLILEECYNLEQIINTTLELAQIEHGSYSSLKKEKIDLTRLLQNAIDLFSEVAELKEIQIKAQIDNHLSIYGIPSQIQRIFANLIDNAIKYSNKNTQIMIYAQQLKEEVQITIQDQGKGISTDDIPKIFDRFFRCEKSRTMKGNGLGLSLVKGFIKVHHGSIKVQSKLKVGTTFTITFPNEKI